MSDVLTIINAMRAAGCDEATILKAVEASECQRVQKAEADAAEKVERKREADKIRKRRRRSEQRTENTTAASAPSAPSARTLADTADIVDAADPSPHTPHPEYISTLKKTPKGVQKGPSVDREAALAAFDRIWTKLPPQAKRRGQETCRMAMLRALTAGAPLANIEAAVEPWLEKSDGMVERFDRWVTEGMWEVWVPQAKPIKAPETPEAWARRIEFYRDRGDWHAPGPRPDEPGCLAPPDVLAAAGFPQLKAIDGGLA
jgi:hypothetical protein